MLRFVFHVALLLFISPVMAAAAELDGVVMPDKQDVAGYHFVLNGLGLRTYSILRVHVYVAGLYLERRTSDPNAILGSSQPKLLRFVFVRNVDAEDARKSWREALDQNCPAPCPLPSGQYCSVHGAATCVLSLVISDPACAAGPARVKQRAKLSRDDWRSRRIGRAHSTDGRASE